jgi:hypothetical protein
MGEKEKRDKGGTKWVDIGRKMEEKDIGEETDVETVEVRQRVEILGKIVGSS